MEHVNHLKFAAERPGATALWGFCVFVSLPWSAGLGRRFIYERRLSTGLAGVFCAFGNVSGSGGNDAVGKGLECFHIHIPWWKDTSEYNICIYIYVLRAVRAVPLVSPFVTKYILH